MYSSEGPGLKSQLGPEFSGLFQLMKFHILSFTRTTCVSMLTLIGVGVRYCLGVELGAEPSPS